jgi:hypothetical protein
MPKKKAMHVYNSMEELLMRKEQLAEVIELEDQEIKRLWGALTAKDEHTTRSEQLTKYFSYGLMAYDALMMLRKLKKGYGSIANIFRK